MKPPKDQTEKFIAGLLARGWEIRGDLIYSEKDFLHFPYPDGWYHELDDLKEVMDRRKTRFKDPIQEPNIGDEDRVIFIAVHQQAFDAIEEAQK